MVVYLFGPGFGESVVLGTPDGQWVVVDCCMDGGVCVPLVFLRERGVTDVAAVVVTHADLDHLDGLPVLERRRVPGAWNNGLSVALAARWEGHRLLFPSDLEVVGEDPKR